MDKKSTIKMMYSEIGTKRALKQIRGTCVLLCEFRSDFLWGGDRTAEVLIISRDLLDQKWRKNGREEERRKERRNKRSLLRKKEAAKGRGGRGEGKE